MEITVTRGLSEIKLLEKRIEKETSSAVLVNFVVGKKPVKGYKSNDDFEKKAKATYQSVNDLIARRNAIKSAIVKSNALTLVTIGGVQMTVAEAIERKTSIEFEKDLLNKMVAEFNNANYQVDKKNVEVQKNLDNLLLQNFGKEAKAKSDEIEAITKPYLEINEAKLVDPLGLQEKIEALSKKIDYFEAEVDHALNESNTITKVVIPD